jgi:hypothetical protein
MRNNCKGDAARSLNTGGSGLLNVSGATERDNFSKCLKLIVKKGPGMFEKLSHECRIFYAGSLCAIFAAGSNICYAEDLNYIKLNDPVRYEKKYIDAENNVITNFMDIEEGKEKIRFHLMTVTHGSVCELSGEAWLSQQESERSMRTYQFDHEKCHLSIQKDVGKGTVLALDPGGACSGYVCGQSGVINGYEFSLKK